MSPWLEAALVSHLVTYQLPVCTLTLQWQDLMILCCCTRDPLLLLLLLQLCKGATVLSMKTLCCWVCHCFILSGTTTTTESLYMGVPCMTLAGQCHAHNVGVSLLTAVGLADEWVAHTKEQYISLAVQHAAEPQKLQELRQGLREKMLRSQMCKAEPFVRQLEGVYKKLWGRWVDEGGISRQQLVQQANYPQLQQQQQQQEEGEGELLVGEQVVGSSSTAGVGQEIQPLPPQQQQGEEEGMMREGRGNSGGGEDAAASGGSGFGEALAVGMQEQQLQQPGRQQQQQQGAGGGGVGGLGGEGDAMDEEESGEEEEEQHQQQRQQSIEGIEMRAVGSRASFRAQQQQQQQQQQQEEVETLETRVVTGATAEESVGCGGVFERLGDLLGMQGRAQATTATAGGEGGGEGEQDGVEMGEDNNGEGEGPDLMKAVGVGGVAGVAGGAAAGAAVGAAAGGGAGAGIGAGAGAATGGVVGAAGGAAVASADKCLSGGRRKRENSEDGDEGEGVVMSEDTGVLGEIDDVGTGDVSRRDGGGGAGESSGGTSGGTSRGTSAVTGSSGVGEWLVGAVKGMVGGTGTSGSSRGGGSSNRREEEQQQQQEQELQDVTAHLKENNSGSSVYGISTDTRTSTKGSSDYATDEEKHAGSDSSIKSDRRSGSSGDSAYVEKSEGAVPAAAAAAAELISQQISSSGTSKSSSNNSSTCITCTVLAGATADVELASMRNGSSSKSSGGRDQQRLKRTVVNGGDPLGIVGLAEGLKTSLAAAAAGAVAGGGINAGL